MGGKYFAKADPPLDVPRMKPLTYLMTKGRVFEILRQYFLLVDSPAEAPEKDSFGDIDVVVYGPISAGDHDEKIFYDILMKALEPKRLHTDSQNYRSSSGDLIYHAAIPWPEDIPEKPASITKDRAKGKKLFIQIDICVSKTPQAHRWNLFKHAHGDIWSMLGSMIRHYGLVVDEEALHLRISEIEDYDRKRARVALTSDPDEILSFLGLDSKEYWKGSFKSFEELFNYIARCPMFYVAPGDYLADQANLKANERKRMDLRPGYRRWVEVYIPTCRALGMFVKRRTSREEVSQKAFARFDVLQDFNERRKGFRLEKQRDFIWKHMIKAMPLPPDFLGNKVYQGVARKAIKHAILGGGQIALGGPAEFKTEDGYYDEAKILWFLHNHAEMVGRAAYEEHQAAYHARVAAQAISQ